MDINAVATELRLFIRERFNVPPDDDTFSDEVDLFNYGYIDSLGALELTSFIERQFSIHFSATDWVAFPLSNIREISTFISKRQKGEL